MAMISSLHSLIYVSRSRIDRQDADAHIAMIIAVSRARNPILDVTGSLIASERFFTQILEGPRASLDALMSSIEADERHDSVTVVRREALSDRRFSNWSMAYSGAASYVDRDILPLFEPRTNVMPATDTDRLVRLFKAFVAAA